MSLVSTISDDNNNKSQIVEQAKVWTTDGWPSPTANYRKVMGGPLVVENYLLSLCQQKGQDLSQTNTYYFNDAKPTKKPWIFIIDSGFDLNHPELAATADRKVKTYVMPNTVALKKISRSRRKAGWLPGKELINDVDDTESMDHGTAVAGLAAGLKYGVSNANLYLLKVHGYYVNNAANEVEEEPLTEAGLVNLFNKIYDAAVHDADIDPALSVINISWRKWPPSPGPQNENTVRSRKTAPRDTRY